MEAITKYGSKYSQGFVHGLPPNRGLFVPVGSQRFPRNSLPKKLVVTKASDHEMENRPLMNFPPSVMDDHRFHTLSFNHPEMEELGRDIEALKPIVSEKLFCSDAKERVLLIHTLVSLGVAYHFEKEIGEFLKDAFGKVNDMIIGEEDLYTVSVIFRVFRLHGHNVSSDMFNRFKGEDGNFKQCLITDVRGMLSFYEASHLGTNAEGILDEAMCFTQKHLEVSVGGTNQPRISKHIQSVLHLSQRENIEVLVAREYIRFYEQEVHHDDMLLKFAKLNFNFMRLQYIQELQTLTKWWKELDLVSKIPNYFRDRLVEGHFWTIGIYMEPQYSVARIILSKCLALIIIMDDACDAYCTLTEVTGFFESLDRWDADAIETLPDHLKVLLRSTIDLFDELKEEVRSEGRLCSVECAIDELKRLFKADLEIAKWARTRYVPSFDEYMEVGLVTGGIDWLVAVAFIGMGNIADEKAYEWLKSRPKLIQALDLKSRLRDDAATFKDEMGRGEVANGINCYMKQYKVTEAEAFLEFDQRIKHTSRVVNEEFLRMNGVVPLQLLLVALNYERLIDVNYKYGDGLTYVEIVKDQISSLLLDPITL